MWPRAGGCGADDRIWRLYNNVWGGGYEKSGGMVNRRVGKVVVTSVSERGTRQNVTRRWQKVCHNGALTSPWFFGTVIA